MVGVIVADRHHVEAVDAQAPQFRLNNPVAGVVVDAGVATGVNKHRAVGRHQKQGVALADVKRQNAGV